MESLTATSERVLFGLDAPPGERGGKTGQKPVAGGGTEVCPYCGKEGLTTRGLALHIARMHKEETEKREAGETEAFEGLPA